MTETFLSTRFRVFRLPGLFAVAILACSPHLFGQEKNLPTVHEAERELEYLEMGRLPRRLPEIEAIGISHQGVPFDEVWGLALQHNPSIRQKKHLVTAAKGACLQAGLYPNPSLNYAGDNLGVNSMAGKHGLGMTQELVTAKKKQWDRTVASYDVEAAKKEYEMECRKLYNDLRIAFAGMLHAQLTVQIERYSERLSNELLQVALKLQREGKSRPIDVLQFRTTLKESALQFRLAENNQRTAWRQLITVIGCPDWPQQIVQGSLVEEHGHRNWDATWAMLRAESPQLDIACLKVRQAQANLTRQHAYRVGNVTATFSVAQDMVADETVPFVSLSTPIKIYDKNQGNIRKAQAELAAANQEVERVLLSLHGELAEVFRNYQNAQETVRTFETSILPDTFEALHQLNDLYHSGKINYLELYTQRHAVLGTLLRYNDALKEQTISAALIDGMLLQGTIKR